MSASQIIVNNDPGNINETFFKQRLSYYIHGAHQCLSLMEEFDQATDGVLLDLAKHLVGKIDHLAKKSREVKAKPIQIAATPFSDDDSEGEDFNPEELRFRHKEPNTNDQKKFQANEEFQQVEEHNQKFGQIERKNKNKENETQTTAPESHQEKYEPENIKFLPHSTLNSANKVQDKAIQATNRIDGREFISSTQIARLNPRNQLQSKVEELHQGYLKSAYKKINEAKILTNDTFLLNKNKHIGNNCTLIAIKNHSSYMVATIEKGIVVGEKAMILYSEPFTKYIKDLIYIDDYDAYFLCVDNKLYRKDIDGKPPYLLMNFSCGFRVAACFRYSKINKRLIANMDGKLISVINLDTKEVEALINDPDLINLYDFKLVGEFEDRVISARKDNILLLYKIDYLKKKGEVTTKLKLPVFELREEQVKTLSICPKKEYVFMEIGQVNSALCSRMFLVRLIGDTLTVTRKIDLYPEKLGVKIALECFGYLGHHILWVGLTKGKNGQAMMFDYDTETQHLRELKRVRAPHKELGPVQMVKLGQDFYYIGYKGNPKKLVVSM